MEEQLVSLGVARLLKEKGFCNGSTHYYSNLNSKQELHKNDNGAVYINGMELDFIEAPTQSLVQKWLREEHNMFVECYHNNLLTERIHGVKYGRYNMSIYEHSMFNMFGFDTYERALEAGIKKALKLI